MNNDEIKTMSAGREMDKLIEERVFGAVFHNGYQTTSAGDKFQGTPRYSTDISAAWEVMQIIKQRYNFSILMHNYDTQWEMAIYVDEKTDEYARLFARAETAPLAICRAALLCVSSI